MSRIFSRSPISSEPVVPRSTCRAWRGLKSGLQNEDSSPRRAGGWPLHFLLLGPLAVMRIEIELPDPQAFGSHFKKFIAVDKPAAARQGHLYGLCNFDGSTCLRSTVVGETLLLSASHTQVVAQDVG